MTAAVEARELFCLYASRGGVAALQGLTLAVEEGEVCVVLGPSGSGKTTLMRIVAGFERPSAGIVIVAGLDLGSLPQRLLARYRAETLGYADQHYWRALAGELTAEELVGVPLGLAGSDCSIAPPRIRESSRAGSSSGSRSAPRSLRAHACSSPTSRPASSTP